MTRDVPPAGNSAGNPAATPGASSAATPGPPSPAARALLTPDEIRTALGDDTTVTDAYGLATADVPPERWTAALTAARDILGLTFFDWLSGVDEAPGGFAVVAHLCAAPGPRLLLRTRLPRETPHLATATGVYAGAAWHERETAEMFGIVFDDHPHPAPLLLPDGFEGHPLRKDFVLASRVAKPWPGAKEPGESDHAAASPSRRRTLPPGVPPPDTWGPRAPHPQPTPSESATPTPETPPSRRDRPRRMRSASEGAASQRPETDRSPAVPDPQAPPAAPSDRPRRARRASEGSASQREEARESTESGTSPGSGAVTGGGAASGPQPPADRPRRARRASEGSASQRRATGEGPAASGGGRAGGGDASEPPSRTVPQADRSTAPRHDRPPAPPTPSPPPASPPDAPEPGRSSEAEPPTAPPSSPPDEPPPSSSEDA